MTALRPVIVVRSSVQKPATSARRDSARIDRPATVGIVLAPSAGAAPRHFFLEGGAMNFIEKSAIITGE
jgi:hypothetical protein